MIKKNSSYRCGQGQGGQWELKLGGGAEETWLVEQGRTAVAARGGAAAETAVAALGAWEEWERTAVAAARRLGGATAVAAWRR